MTRPDNCCESECARNDKPHRACSGRPGSLGRSAGHRARNCYCRAGGRNLCDRLSDRKNHRGVRSSRSLSCRDLSCCNLSCRNLSCRNLSCRNLSCRNLSGRNHGLRGERRVSGTTWLCFDDVSRDDSRPRGRDVKQERRSSRSLAAMLPGHIQLATSTVLLLLLLTTKRTRRHAQLLHRCSGLARVGATAHDIACGHGGIPPLLLLKAIAPRRRLSRHLETPLRRPHIFAL